MYSWGGDPSDWYGSGSYSYKEAGAAKRKEAADKAGDGPRTYARAGAPEAQLIDPKKAIRTRSKHPVIVAIDVTGSMARWPFEIFDRLPLLYNTLSQYREDLELAFIAFGDHLNDSWPFQVTDFGGGFDLESHVGAMWGEGRGGDVPESYGLIPWYVNNRVTVDAPDPFLIVFGDAPMHETMAAPDLAKLFGVPVQSDCDAIAEWQRTARTWNTWFLRRPTGSPGDDVDQQWQRALGAKRVVRIDDEQRAVDCAMGIIARAWGCLDDFTENMLARQTPETVERVTHWIERFGIAALNCPKCNAPVPKEAVGRFSCAHCGATLEL